MGMQLHGRIGSSLPRVRRSDVRSLLHDEGSVPPMALRTDQCVIGLWRGYVKAQFYARPPDRDVGFCFSPMFDVWRGPWRRPISISDDPAARAALELLEAWLTDHGWERMRRANGGDWYELRFRPGTSVTRPLATVQLRAESSFRPRAASATRSVLTRGRRSTGAAIRSAWRWGRAGLIGLFEGPERRSGAVPDEPRDRTGTS